MLSWQISRSWVSAKSFQGSIAFWSCSFITGWFSIGALEIMQRLNAIIWLQSSIEKPFCDWIPVDSQPDKAICSPELIWFQVLFQLLIVEVSPERGAESPEFSQEKRSSPLQEVVSLSSFPQALKSSKNTENTIKIQIFFMTLNNNKLKHFSFLQKFKSKRSCFSISESMHITIDVDPCF